MKKISLFLAVVAVSLCLSSNAFAKSAAATGVSDAQGQTLFGATPADLDIARASKGVFFAWSTGTNGYAITTYHQSGTKLYGTAYDSTALFFDDVGTGYQDSLAAPASSDSADAFADWTQM